MSTTWSETDHPRTVGGRWAAKAPAAEAEVSLEPGAPDPADPTSWSEQVRSETAKRAAAAHELRRGATCDPNTGACSTEIRSYSWSDPETGEYEDWTEDLANTPYVRLSEQAQNDVLARHACLEAEAGDPPKLTQNMVQRAYERTGRSVGDTTGPERDAWNDHAAAVLKPDMLPREVYVDVTAHEADGGSVQVSDDGEHQRVAWRTDSEPDSSLYRRPRAGSYDAPAHFTDSRPDTWVRGMDLTRTVESDGATRTMWAETGRTRSLTSADGKEFTYYDAAGEIHRPEGPARVDADGRVWASHGQHHRDPDAGPAVLAWTGQAEYSVDGVTVDPTPDQAARHGVEAYGPERPDRDSYDRPQATRLWRAFGTDPERDIEQIETHDWSSSPAYGSD